MLFCFSHSHQGKRTQRFNSWGAPNKTAIPGGPHAALERVLSSGVPDSARGCAAAQWLCDSVTEAAWGWGSHWRTVLVSCDLMDVLVHGVSGTLIMKCLLDTFQSTSEVLRSRKDIHTPSFLSLTWSGLVGCSAFTCGQWKNKPFPGDLSEVDLKLSLHKPLFFWTLKEHLKDKLSKCQCC